MSHTEDALILPPVSPTLQVKEKISLGTRNKATTLYKSHGTVGGLSQNYINSLGDNVKRKLKIFQSDLT